MSNLPKLIHTAIQASLQKDWETAIDTNLHILQLKSNDVPTLNRLAKAYEKIGDIDKAKKTYRKVLNQNRYNNIALNNLDRLKNHQPSSVPQNTNTNFSFVEEPGKTKTIQLTKLAPKSIISNLEISEIVILKPNKRHISVYSQSDCCIGSLPDDLSAHLIRLIKLGNKYQAVIKNISKNQIEIFIKETHQSRRLKGLASFPSKNTKDYYSLLPTDPIAEVPLEIPNSENPDLELSDTD